MDYRKEFIVEPGTQVRLSKIDPDYKDKHLDHEAALPDLEANCKKLGELQHLLYAEKKHSLLVVLQDRKSVV
jgi:hypothetical protein